MNTEEQPIQQKAQQAKIVNLLRVLGTGFMLLGVASIFNLGGIVTTIGLKDALAGNIFGGGMIFLGIFEYFALPLLLEKLSNKANNS
jgi:hypothetical protein